MQINQETKEIRFGDLYEIPSRNGVSKPKRVRGSGFPMVNMGEIFKYDKIYDSIGMELAPLTLKEQANSLLMDGDLLFARQSLVAEGAGKCSIFKGTTRQTTFESHLIRVRLKKDIANPDFFYYYFSSPRGKAKTQSLVMQVAAAGIRGSELENLNVDYLPLKTQKAIASTLSLFDDLIENNKRRIYILETLAQKIYTEWFVNFRFPGSEKIRFGNDGLPDGWEVKRVEDVIKRVSAGRRYENKTVKPTGKVPVLDQGRSGIIGYHNDEPSVVASTDDPIIVFANHTCYQNLIMFAFSAIQNVLPFLPLDDRNVFWLHFATKNLISFNDYKGHWPEFMTKKLNVPPVEVTDKFGREVRECIVLKYKLEKQNEILIKSRDLILPQLVTGKLEIKS